MSDEIEIITDDLSFKLLSYNWRKQDNKINGPNCLFSFLQVQNGVPATITIYNFKEEAESVEEVKDSVEKNTSSQGWEIISSELKNIGDKEVFDLIGTSKIDNQELELHSIVTFNKNTMYVFELLSFANDKYASDDFENILNSLKFF